MPEKIHVLFDAFKLHLKSENQHLNSHIPVVDTLFN